MALVTQEQALRKLNELSSASRRSAAPAARPSSAAGRRTLKRAGLLSHSLPDVGLDSPRAGHQQGPSQCAALGAVGLARGVQAPAAANRIGREGCLAAKLGAPGCLSNLPPAELDTASTFAHSLASQSSDALRTPSEIAELQRPSAKECSDACAELLQPLKGELLQAMQAELRAVSRALAEIREEARTEKSTLSKSLRAGFSQVLGVLAEFHRAKAEVDLSGVLGEIRGCRHAVDAAAARAEDHQAKAQAASSHVIEEVRSGPPELLEQLRSAIAKDSPLRRLSTIESSLSSIRAEVCKVQSAVDMPLLIDEIRQIPAKVGAEPAIRSACSASGTGADLEPVLREVRRVHARLDAPPAPAKASEPVHLESRARGASVKSAPASMPGREAPPPPDLSPVLSAVAELRQSHAELAKAVEAYREPRSAAGDGPALDLTPLLDELRKLGAEVAGNKLDVSALAAQLRPELSVGLEPALREIRQAHAAPGPPCAGSAPAGTLGREANLPVDLSPVLSAVAELRQSHAELARAVEASREPRSTAGDRPALDLAPLLEELRRLGAEVAGSRLDVPALAAQLRPELSALDMGGIVAKTLSTLADMGVRECQDARPAAGPRGCRAAGSGVVPGLDLEVLSRSPVAGSHWLEVPETEVSVSYASGRGASLGVGDLRLRETLAALGQALDSAAADADGSAASSTRVTCDP